MPSVNQNGCTRSATERRNRVFTDGIRSSPLVPSRNTLSSVWRDTRAWGGQLLLGEAELGRSREHPRRED